MLCVTGSFGSTIRSLRAHTVTSARVAVLTLSLAILLLASGARATAQTFTAVPVPTWRYDLTHAGQNTHETALTPANVNPTTFGKLFSLPVDGLVYAQPLYVPGLTMADGQPHNVLFVATEHDSVYAFDADSNGGKNATPLWHASLISTAYGAAAGATTVSYLDADSPDVAPEIGITGTHALDTASNTLWVVANSKENGQYVSRLHALNLVTGAEQANSPVVVEAAVAGTGDGSSGGQLAFSALRQNQRSALNYYNGHVYFAYGAHGDIAPWHGWIFAYDGKTLQQTGVLCLSPNGTGAGVWESGAGMPIDTSIANGRMFVTTGNGSRTDFPPFDQNTEFGETTMAIDLSNGGLTPIDGFTSYNWKTLNTYDLDQGAGGVLFVPDAQPGAAPHVAVQVGKEGRILVLNRDNLGGIAPAGSTSNPNALQDLPQAVQGLWSTPAYWNGNVYMWGEQDTPKLFQFNGAGQLNATPSSQGSVTSDFPGASFSISSNGNQDGIAWAVKTDGFDSHAPGVLYAWDATNLGTQLYSSDTNAARDSAVAANKFAIPVVTNGKVYVSGRTAVDVYGLLGSVQVAAAPVITPQGGTFGTTQTVTMTDTTPNATIFYTLDGSVPSVASQQYTGPIQIDTDATVRALASANGYSQSAVSTAVFNFSDQTPPIKFTPAGGNYKTVQSVTLSDPDNAAKIYYTTDGSQPTSASTPYTGPILVNTTMTLRAIAIDPALRNSNVGTAAYVIQLASTTVDFSSGFSTTDGLQLNGSARATDDTRLQLTDGGLQETGSVYWNTPINVQSFTTDFQFQLSSAQGDGFTFTLQNTGVTTVGANGAGLGYAGIAKSAAIKFDFYSNAGEGNNSTGLYVNGAVPTLPAIDLTPSGIVLSSGDTIAAHVYYDGTTLNMKLTDQASGKTFMLPPQTVNIPQLLGGNAGFVGFTGGTGGLSASQKLLTWTYQAGVANANTVAPTFAPAAGTYNAPQMVMLSTTTLGAVIYYTTDGSTPTTSSTLYNGPIMVGAGTHTIQAIAVTAAAGNSAVASATYVIQGTAPAPSAGFALSSTAPTAVTPGAAVNSTITITPNGGFTGNVALTCAVTAAPANAASAPTCAVTAPAAISGSGSVTSTLTVSTQAATTPGAYTITVTGTSGSVSATTAVPVSVSTLSGASANFTLSAPAITITSPATSGSSTLTITPAGGFTGNVSLTCAITGSPAGAAAGPSCSATAAPAIVDGKPVTATLTFTATAATSGALHLPFEKMLSLGGSGALAALLFFVPVRRRGWKLLCSLLLFATVAGMASGCGSASSKTITTTGGPTKGNYTLTVTGTSGSTVATTAVTVTVN